MRFDSLELKYRGSCFYGGRYGRLEKPASQLLSAWCMPGTIAATRSFMKILFHCACWLKETQRLEMNGLLLVSPCVSSAPAAAVRVNVPISSFVLLNMQYFYL